MDGRVAIDQYVCKICGRKWGELFVKLDVQLIFNAQGQEQPIFVPATDKHEANMVYVQKHITDLYKEE